MRYYYCILILVCLCFLNACKHYSSKNELNEKDTLLAKNIVFPKSLFVLEGTESSKIDAFLKEIKGKSKIISIIDGTCIKCVINQLNCEDSVFNSIIDDSDKQMIFILNVNKKDSVYFMRNIQSALNAKGVILWDNNYNFERKNKLFTPDLNLRTFMTNSENRIVYYGNPALYPELIYEYQEMFEMY